MPNPLWDAMADPSQRTKPARVDLTKAMVYGSGLWELVYAHGFWAPFRRDDLEEDYFTMEPSGEIIRWRICNN